MAEAKVYQAKDPAALSRFLVILLWIDLAAGLVAALSGVVEIRMLGALPPDTALLRGGPPLPATVLIGIGLIDLAQVISMLVTGFFCLKWIYRVSMNAHVLVAQGLTITPPWAMGWYFIPFANLLKPFQALKEAWQASVNPSAWRSIDPPPLMRWWWGLWLASGVLGNISFRLSLEAKSLDMLTFSDFAQVAADLVGLPLNLVFIVLVRRLADHQVKALSQQVFS
jgi:hypothetical protein